MAFNVGTITEFDDPKTISDPAVFVTAKAIKMAARKSAFYQMMTAPLTGFKPYTQAYEVYSRSKTAKGGTVSGAWNATDTEDLGVDATSIKGLTVGSVLKMATGEYVIVKAVNRTAVTINVYARGAGGTTGAIQADASAYAVVGFAGKDSELKNVESLSESTGVYTNYIQTIFETLDWEFQGANLRRKGLDDDSILTVLMNEAMIRVAESLGVMSIHGKKQLGASGGTPYMSAGLLAQLADTAGGTRPIINYDASGAFTETKLRAALQEVFVNGSPDTIICSAANKEIINGFNSSITQTTRTDTEAGSYVDTYNYDGAMLTVKVDADMPDDTIAIVTIADCKVSWVEGDMLRLKDEPTTSSREFRQSLQGSLGFAVENVGYDHTYIYGITS